MKDWDTRATKKTSEFSLSATLSASEKQEMCTMNGLPELDFCSSSQRFHQLLAEKLIQPLFASSFFFNLTDYLKRAGVSADHPSTSVHTSSPTSSPTSSCPDCSIDDRGPNYCQFSSKCSQCQGDCDDDDDCEKNLICFQRTNSEEKVPGCTGEGYVKTTSDHDYCAVSNAKEKQKLFNDNFVQYGTPRLYGVNVDTWKIQNGAIGEEKNIQEVIATIQSISRQDRLPLVVEKDEKDESGGRCAWTPYVEGGKRRKQCSDVLRDIYDDECFLGKLFV